MRNPNRFGSDPEETTGLDTVMNMEICNIAMDMEMEACAYYDAAASLSEKDALKRVFEKLARMEQGHLKHFENIEKSFWKLKDSLSEGDVNLRTYLSTLIGQRSAKTLNPRERVEKVIKSGKPRKIIEDAIEKEKEAILIYLGLSNALGFQKARETVDQIITEEMNHIVILNNLLTTLDNGGEID